jgi:class 3 adenylate cyclase/predicted ATPase
MKNAAEQNAPQVYLAARLEQGEIVSSLTDTRSVGRWARAPFDAIRLHALTRQAASKVGGDSRAAAEALYEVLFPGDVGAFLRRSPDRTLTLQLPSELDAFGWELACDGSRQIGEKFAVGRRLLDDESVSTAWSRPVAPARRRLRVSFVQDAGSSDALAERELADRRFDANYVFPTELVSKATAIRKQLGDVIHISGSDAIEKVLSRRESFWRQPPGLFVLVLPESEAACAVAVALCRCGAAVLLVAPDSAHGSAWIDTLYSALADGVFVSEAVRQVNRSYCSAGAGPWMRLYGSAESVLVLGAQRSPPADDLRQLTALSFDLVESTQLVRRLGGEAYAGLLASFHKLCTAVIKRHAGIPDDPQGDDGVMSYFGLPVATEHAAESAIDAGLELIEAVVPLEVAVRVGVATGRVAVQAGQPVGESIHLAARLQKLAKPGTLLVSQATRALVAHRFELEAMGTKQTLKGIEEAQAVYRVIRRRVDNRLDSAPHLTPFVGRESELVSLVDNWNRASNGSLRIVLLQGEAGIGKSRLVREFRRTLKRRGQDCLECRCLAHKSQSAFQVIADTLRRFFALELHDDDASRLDKIVRRVPPGQDADEAVPLIAALLSIPCEPRFRPAAGPPERLRERTMATMVKWYQHASRTAPFCLVVEDAHWVDPSTREFLTRLVSHSESLPMMVLMTSRPEVSEGWKPPVVHQQIELRGLPPIAARQLVEQACGDAVLPSRVVRLLAARADGVPLFLEESARMALELSAAGESDASPLALDVPFTLQDLLMARLDRLGPAKAVAQLGAVLGREFSVTLLEEVLTHAGLRQVRVELLAHLDAIEQSGLILRIGDAGSRRYAFKHALVRDTAYQSLWERDRQRLHKAVASVLPAISANAAEWPPELLAYHQTEAGLDDDALVQWEVAARAAAARSAHDEAISHIEQALDLLRRRADDPERDRIELRLQLLLASRCIATEGYGAARVERIYARAQLLSEKVGDMQARLKVALGLEGYHFMRAEFPLALRIARQAAVMAKSVDDPMSRLQAAWASANILFHKGHGTSAVRRMDECLAQYRPEAHRRGAVQDPGVMCLCYSAWGQWELGYPDDALKRIERVLDLARSLDHKFSLGEAWGFAANVHRYRGEFETALACADSAIAICEEGGFAVWLAHARIMRGWLLCERGRVIEGLTQMREGDALWRRTGAVVTRPLYLTLQAEGLARDGDLPGSLALLSDALQLVQRKGERYFEAEIRRLTGELTMKQAALNGQDGAAEAEHWLLSALDVAQRQRKRGFALRSATSLAQLWGRKGRRKEAFEVLQPALAVFTEGLDTLDLRDARKFLHELSTDQR